MSQQFASLKKQAIFLLGDAEENGLTAIITGVYRDPETGYYLSIGLSQQTAAPIMPLLTLPAGTSITWNLTNITTGETTTPPPILIASSPVPWPPGTPEPEPITEFLIGGMTQMNTKYQVSILKIDIPNATFRTTNPSSFTFNTPNV